MRACVLNVLYAIDAKSNKTTRNKSHENHHAENNPDQATNFMCCVCVTFLPTVFASDVNAMWGPYSWIIILCTTSLVDNLLYHDRLLLVHWLLHRLLLIHLWLLHRLLHLLHWILHLLLRIAIWLLLCHLNLLRIDLIGLHHNWLSHTNIFRLVLFHIASVDKL